MRGLNNDAIDGKATYSILDVYGFKYTSMLSANIAALVDSILKRLAQMLPPDSGGSAKICFEHAARIRISSIPICISPQI